MHPNISKWWQTIKISWSKTLTYRVNFLMQIIGPALVFFFIKYNLWNSIYAGDESTVIAGYRFPEMITYHVWTLVVGLVGISNNSAGISEEIRLGKISSYLIYPFNFWEFHTASFLAFEVIQYLVASITLVILFYIGVLPDVSALHTVLGFIFCFFVACFWFSMQFIVGLIAFWLNETWSIRIILITLTSFLSGYLIPLELYPSWLTDILAYTPFPYLSFYPVKIFMGDTTHFFSGLAILIGWSFVSFFVGSLIFKKGVRLYTAAGM